MSIHHFAMAVCQMTRTSSFNCVDFSMATWKKRGNVCYADQAELDFFLSLFIKYTDNLQIIMIQVSWYDHFISAIFLPQIKNLEDPYETKCTDKKLKAFSSYTTKGCFYECLAEHILESCKCRSAGYSGLCTLLFMEEQENRRRHRNVFTVCQFSLFIISSKY